MDVGTQSSGRDRTDQIPGGRRGEPCLRYGGRLVCNDVGIGSGGGAPAAFVVEKERMYYWRPEDPRIELGDLPELLEAAITQAV